MLYNSIYLADRQLFVNQHAYGIPAAQSPVYCFRHAKDGDLADAYLQSFKRIWNATSQPRLAVEPYDAFVPICHTKWELRSTYRGNRARLAP